MKKTFPSLIVIALCALGFFQFCVKPPDYPKEPVIEFIGLSPNILNQTSLGGNDSVIITFSYTDGDGDLGYQDPDPTPSIFIKDSRDSFIRYSYQLPYVQPQGAGNGISGDVAIKLPSSCCTFTTPQGQKLSCENVPVMLDTLFYLVTIKDRAGHTSNEIQCGPITLVCH